MLIFRNGRTYKVLVADQNSLDKVLNPIESNNVTPSVNAGSVPDRLPSGTDEAVQRDNQRMLTKKQNKIFKIE